MIITISKKGIPKGLEKAYEEITTFFPKSKFPFLLRIRPIIKSKLRLIYDEKDVEKINEEIGKKAIVFPKKMIKMIINTFKENEVKDFIKNESNIKNKHEKIKLIVEMMCYLKNKNHVIQGLNFIKALKLDHYSGIISGFVPALKQIDEKSRFTALIVFISKLKGTNKKEALALQVKYAINPLSLIG